jgi:hypothetical protein
MPLIACYLFSSHPEATVFLFLIDRLIRKKEAVAPPIRMPMSTERTLITARDAQISTQKTRRQRTPHSVLKKDHYGYGNNHDNERNHAASLLVLLVKAKIKKSRGRATAPYVV